MSNPSPLRTYAFQIGAILMLIGTALPIFCENFLYAIISYTTGIALFVPCQLLERPHKTSPALKRLRFQQYLGALMLVLTAILMFTHYFYVRPFIGQEWKMTLIIAAVFETYTAFRIPNEIKKLNQE